ncbi:hypothetical protein B566_EDAN014135, partial [Ephemera danica]
MHSECSSYGQTCKIRCNACYVCVHMMSCNCVEAMVGAGLCKHIHAVVMKYFVQMDLLPKTQLLTHSDMIIQDNVEDINATLSVPTQKELRYKQITSKLQSLQAIAHTKLPYCDGETMDSIEAQIQQLKFTLLSCKINDQPINFGNNVHPNQNIVPQPRMISTRKKKSKQLSLRKPNLQERGVIVDDLLKRRKVVASPNVYDQIMETYDSINALGAGTVHVLDNVYC